MILAIKNPKIIKTTMDDGTESLRLSFELKDPMNDSMFPIKQNVFENQNPSWINDWKRWLPEDRGGDWVPEDDTEDWSLKVVPKNLKFLTKASIEEFDLGGPHFQIYSREMNGHSKGDVVMRNGQVKITNKITIVTQFEYAFIEELDEFGNVVIDDDGKTKRKVKRDENGNPIIAGQMKGWTTDEVGQSMASLYIPMEKLPQYLGETDTEEEEYDEYEEETDNEVEETEEEEKVVTPRNSRRNVR